MLVTLVDAGSPAGVLVACRLVCVYLSPITSLVAGSAGVRRAGGVYHDVLCVSWCVCVMFHVEHTQ